MFLYLTHIFTLCCSMCNNGPVTWFGRLLTRYKEVSILKNIIRKME